MFTLMEKSVKSLMFLVHCRWRLTNAHGAVRGREFAGDPPQHPSCIT
jgi:hypothetical protein